jgi:hypothetical protein
MGAAGILVASEAERRNRDESSIAPFSKNTTDLAHHIPDPVIEGRKKLVVEVTLLIGGPQMCELSRNNFDRASDRIVLREIASMSELVDRSFFKAAVVSGVL